MCVRVPGIEGSDDEALDSGGHDEEVSRWEQEQIRKGISIPQVRLSDNHKHSRGHIHHFLHKGHNTCSFDITSHLRITMQEVC